MARIYLTLDDTLFINEEQLRLYGGAPGLQDPGLVESALLRPQTGYYADLIDEAAALWDSLAMNQGFVDGNKRVALACTIVFLEANGTEIIADPDDLTAFIYHHLEAGSFRKDVLDAWPRTHTEAD